MKKGKTPKKNFGENSINLVKNFLENGGLINKKERTFVATGNAKLAILFLLIAFAGISTSPKTRFILAKSIKSIY